MVESAAALLASLRHPAIPAVRDVGRLRDGRALWRRLLSGAGG